MNNKGAQMRNEHPIQICPPNYENVMADDLIQGNVGFTNPISYPSATAPLMPVMSPPTFSVHCNAINSGPAAGGTEQGGNKAVGQNSQATSCSSCRAVIKTKTHTYYKCKTHCCCVLLCLSGAFCPCFFLPYCCCSPEKVVHVCPKCKSLVGTYYG